MKVTTGTRIVLRADVAAPWWTPPVILALAISAALVFAPYPPLQDFAEWAYQGALLARMILGLGTPEVSLVTHPVPNSLAQALLGLLSLVLPATLAARVFLLGLLGAGLSVALALARQRQPAAGGAFAVVLLVSVFGNTPFWNGYVNYQLALLLLAAWFVLPPARRAEAWPIVGFGLLIFFSHAAVFAAFCVLVGVRGLLRRRIRAAVLGLTPALLLTAWYVLASPPEPAEADAALGGPGAFLAYKAYTVAKLGPYHNFVFATGGDEILRPALYWAGTLVNLVYAAGLLGMLGFGLWRGRRDRVLSASVLIASLVLLLGFVALPRVAQHVINPGERLLIPGVLMLLLAVPLSARVLRPLAVLGGLALAANLLVLATPSELWAKPVHFRDMAAMGGARAMFRHRPTSFACKWEELRHSEKTGEAPRLPISFRTSLLQTTAPPFDCPVPGGDQDRPREGADARAPGSAVKSGG
ncbi:hypothetical protein E2C06_03415 [Dankookia rubra]|uniref:Glycosyltransferase RgtA/B/C/D-like domain-containing protein n=1 Tax=Dankookia rubra TaxID=1442381 RepID=A0A4R5QMB0_9PROT|nr:hypothetical protein [Dankookia rubra]TDH63897.1 hypothetical protein E2C06_03415 [Dankookia rubra]